MKNAWKVYWIENGKRKRMLFEGDPGWAEQRNLRHYEKALDSAVEFAKVIKRQGMAPEIISVRKAYIPKRDNPRPGPGWTWCPYCVKWRQFRMLRIRRSSYIGAPANRCPVCTISEDDYYVKKYNGRLESLSIEEIRRRHSSAERSAKRVRRKLN